MIALVRSEIAKLTTVRAPRWILLAQVALLVMAASGAVVAGGLDLTTTVGLSRLLEHGGVVAILSLIVGITVSAGEFRHGTVVDTFLTEPRRERVVVAKLVTGALAGLVAGVVVALADVAIAVVWCAVKDVSLDWSLTGRSAVGVALWQTLYTVLGVAVGAMVRAQAAAIVSAVIWLFVAETALGQLADSIAKWLPATAATALGNAPEDGLLSQVGGGLTLTVWALAAGLGAVVLTRRRDLA